jgi:hypothetical protein
MERELPFTNHNILTGWTFQPSLNVFLASSGNGKPGQGHVCERVVMDRHFCSLSWACLAPGLVVPCQSTPWVVSALPPRCLSLSFGAWIVPLATTSPRIARMPRLVDEGKHKDRCHSVSLLRRSTRSRSLHTGLCNRRSPHPTLWGQGSIYSFVIELSLLVTIGEDLFFCLCEE